LTLPGVQLAVVAASSSESEEEVAVGVDPLPAFGDLLLGVCDRDRVLLRP